MPIWLVGVSLPVDQPSAAPATWSVVECVAHWKGTEADLALVEQPNRPTRSNQRGPLGLSFNDSERQKLTILFDRYLPVSCLFYSA